MKGRYLLTLFFIGLIVVDANAMGLSSLLKQVGLMAHKGINLGMKYAETHSEKGLEGGIAEIGKGMAAMDSAMDSLFGKGKGKDNGNNGNNGNNGGKGKGNLLKLIGHGGGDGKSVLGDHAKTMKMLKVLGGI